MDPEEPNNRSSSVSNLTRDSTFRSVSSPTQSPPLQLMERQIPEDYEFEDVRNSPSSSSSEWSSISNESLFSIHVTNSLTHEESMKSDDLTSFSSPIHAESMKMEIKTKLDEPQKVVRWKTQVERPAEEGAPPEGHKWEPSPFNNHHVASEPANHDNSKPKKKVWWSWCKCGKLCNMPKWSCWNGCWKNMACFNCKKKKVSSHSTGASGPKKASASKKDQSKKDQSGPKSQRVRAWSCSCHCCCDEANLLA